MKAKKYYGNNNYLIGVLKRNGFNIDDTYLDKIRGKNDGDLSIQAIYPQGTVNRVVKVKAFIHRDANGNMAGLPVNQGLFGVEDADVVQALQTLNNMFSWPNNTGIRFYLDCDIQLVNDNAYEGVNFTDAIFTAMCNDYHEAGFDALNIHFVFNTDFAVGGQTLIVNGNNYCSSVNSAWGFNDYSIAMVHEIGHLFGLDHTHHNSRDLIGEQRNGDITKKCDQESVSRTKKNGLLCSHDINKTKCSVNGDLLCDTAADPGLDVYGNVLANCDFDADGDADLWNDAWQADARNIMTWPGGNVGCLARFTAMQIGVMYDNMPSFSETPGTVAGVSTTCYNQTLSFSTSSVAGASSYNWQVPSGWTILSGQGSTSVSVRAGSSSGNVSVTPDCGSFTRRKYVAIQPNWANVYGPFLICEGDYASYSTDPVSGSSYTWTVPYGIQIVGGQGSPNTTVMADYGFYGGPVNVYITSSSCSSSGSMYIDRDYNCGFLAVAQATVQSDTTVVVAKGQNDVAVYPNPSVETLKVRLSDTNVRIEEITLQNLHTFEAKKYMVNSSNASIYVGGLERGDYVLIIKTANEIIKRKIILKK